MLALAARLSELGHDLDAEDDPVAALLRHLRLDRQVGTLDDSQAPALIVGLDRLLDRNYGIRL